MTPPPPSEPLGQDQSPPPAAEERLRLILRNIPDYAIFTLDAGGFVTQWPEGAERVKGWKPEEIIGQHVSTFYTPEQIAAGLVEQELAQATANGRAEREDWRVRKGGERFWANEIATAMRGGDGRLLGFTKISRDLTDRKRIEDALRESEERSRLLLENARDYAIFMADPTGRIVTWNTGAERIFGFGEAEVVGRELAVLYTAEDRAAAVPEQELARAVADGRATDERWQVRKGGERFWASGVTHPLRGEGGALRGFVKICRDLTHEREDEQRRERLLEQEQIARLEAERAMALRDEFLAVVSHELRTPLTSILLWAKMLGSGAVSPEAAPQAIETIRQSADAQRQLIEDLLDVSRMISGKQRLDLRETDLAAVVRAAIDAVRPMAEAKNVAIETSLDARAGQVRADPDRLQQVVWNLLSNAVKFTGRGGRVSVRLARVDGVVRVVVADTGRGISPAFLPHVFERFRQADATTTRTEGGLGLGLSITRQLVELHGGTIVAESAGEGRGATFTVELPLPQSAAGAGGPADAGAPRADADSSAADGSLLQGVRVLVAEDEAHTREAVRALLEHRGAEVTAVESAALAVAAFRDGLGRRPFDVLVSDVAMPVQDGYELMREIREMERQRGQASRGVPALAVTALAREEDRARAAAAGFAAHVAKPVEPEPLVDAVARLVGRPGTP